ncbi:MAG: hypothetical protein KDD69_10155 [Bdellovibrionales bacterium]|nr:hypothetical protein [Bdellovibrionales bacterium]
MSHRTTSPVSKQPYSALNTAAQLGLRVGGAAIARIVHGTTERSTPNFHECSSHATLMERLAAGSGCVIGRNGSVEYRGFERMPGDGMIAYHALLEVSGTGDRPLLRVTALHALFADVSDSRNAWDGHCALVNSGGSVAVSRELGFGGRLTSLYRERGRLLFKRDPVVSVGGEQIELSRRTIDRINAFGRHPELALA